ncbi:hypothetical protein AAMO2058_000621600 [Amorphochlora amoebiformis]
MKSRNMTIQLPVTARPGQQMKVDIGGWPIHFIVPEGSIPGGQVKISVPEPKPDLHRARSVPLLHPSPTSSGLRANFAPSPPTGAYPNGSYPTIRGPAVCACSSDGKAKKGRELEEVEAEVIERVSVLEGEILGVYQGGILRKAPSMKCVAAIAASFSLEENSKLLEFHNSHQEAIQMLTGLPDKDVHPQAEERTGVHLKALDRINLKRRKPESGMSPVSYPTQLPHLENQNSFSNSTYMSGQISQESWHVSQHVSKQRPSYEEGRMREVPWLPNNATTVCMFEACEIKFNAIARRHHCRACGQIFCARHTTKRLILSFFGIKPARPPPDTNGGTSGNGGTLKSSETGREETSRVCDKCYNDIAGHSGKGRSRSEGQVRKAKVREKRVLVKNLEDLASNLSWEVNSLIEKGHKRVISDAKMIRKNKSSPKKLSESEPSPDTESSSFPKVFGHALRGTFALQVLSDRPDDPTKHSEGAILLPKHFSESLSHDSYCRHTKFSFTTYAPVAFRSIRHLRGYTDGSFLKSMLELSGGALGAGKSGQLFFKSKDSRFVLKTMPKNEAEVLRSILPTYHSYLFASRESVVVPKISKGNGKNSPSALRTFLARFLGLYALEIEGKRTRRVYLVCMENALKTFGSFKPIRIFDLKGSKQGRYVPPNAQGEFKGVLKDLNWTKNEKAIRLPKRMFQQVRAALERDVALLKSFNIVDYSLLIGISSPSGMSSGVPGGRRIWASVIDILQLFNMKKRGERFVKKQVLGQKDVSCEDAKTYSKRFLDFAFQKIFQAVGDDNCNRSGDGGPGGLVVPCDIGVQGFEAFSLRLTNSWDHLA